MDVISVLDKEHDILKKLKKSLLINQDGINDDTVLPLLKRIIDNKEVQKTYDAMWIINNSNHTLHTPHILRKAIY